MLKDKEKKIKIQIIFILIVTVTTLINMSLTCFAKYVFNYTITVAEVRLEKN